MLSFVKRENASIWRDGVEYPLNICAIILSLACVVTLTDLNVFQVDLSPSNSLGLFLMLYPVFCLARLGVYHFKKSPQIIGWIGALSDLLFVSLLVFHTGLTVFSTGLFYGVIALHSLRFRASQVFSLGVLSVIATLILGANGQSPANPTLSLVCLFIVTGLFGAFAMKAEAALNEVIENKEAADKIKTDHKTIALKSKVINEMGGDLENPMKRVLSASEALSKTKLSNEQKQYVNVLEQSGEALLSAIENIMDFTQMENGALTSKLESFDFEKSLAAIAKTFGSKARNKNLDFLIDIEPGSEMLLMGYEKRLRQIINSLIDNAIKFTSKGHIILRVSSKAINSKLACLSISVEDSGIGLSETQVKALLENHTAEDTAKTDRGLGLKIVQMLLGVQGESLKVISKQGQGSRFFFELHMPYESANEKDVKPSPLPAYIRTLKTLIVSDLPEETDIIEKQLMAVGMNPQIVSDAQSACVAINAAHNNEKDYGLGIIDYDMPEFDGLKLAELIRSRVELNPMKMVILSSSNVSQIEAAFSAITGTYYLQKPYTQSDLTSAIETLTRTSDGLVSDKKVA